MTPEAAGDPGQFTNEVVWNRLDGGHSMIGPFSAATIDRMLQGARLGKNPRILDIGCGLGAWILRALELYPDAHGVGVDVSRAHVERARAEAERRGVDDRFTGQVGDAWDLVRTGDFDLVMCVGLSDVLGGTGTTLRELIRPRLRDGGVVVLGETFWRRPPDEAALRSLGVAEDRYRDLEGVFDEVIAAGGLPVDAHVSTETEWDAYMWACVRALADWGLDEAPPEEQGEILRFMADYRDAWLQGFRGKLGFITLLLRPVPLRLSVLAGRRPAWAPPPWTA